MFIRKKISPVICLTLTILLAALAVSAQTPLTYKDSQKRTVTFPFGAISFADRVVATDRGTRPATSSVALDPNGVLGVPDYVTGQKTYLSLGRNGSVTVEFTDNYLVDIEGPDLWIFEIGPAVESTKLAISKDGQTWIDIGIIKGSTSGIDIAPFVRRGDRFSYVRVTDNNNGGGSYAGADIDAIGAIGSIIREPADTGGGSSGTGSGSGSNGDSCCQKLKVEKTDGSIVFVTLDEGRAINNLTNIRRISSGCEDEGGSGGGTGTQTDGPTLRSEIENGDDFMFVSINGRAAAEATRQCNNRLIRCGQERIGFYGIDRARLKNFKEEIFTYRDQNNKFIGVYLLTQTGFADDSVRGERLRLEFVKQGRGWKLAQGGRQFQCGRGGLAGQWTKQLCP